jgi:alkylated DNA repair dioxygenase AlkB
LLVLLRTRPFESKDIMTTNGSSDFTSQTPACQAIEGLTYFRQFLGEPEELALLAALDKEPWRDDLKRRVQHYGYRYDYKARMIDPSMYLGPLPQWVRSLAARLLGDGHLPVMPDQLIVNEYLPGQGISTHVDCVPCFGPVICSVSLASQCVMIFSSVMGDQSESLLLERGSLLVLSGDARYKWRHAIPARKADKFSGEVLARGRRVSLTFRTVIGGRATAID